MLETVGIGMKTTIVPELQAAGVVYYLFPDRTTANKFWGSRSANYNTTSYCAFTGYGASLTNRDIAVMIRTKCSNQWTGGLDTNMWIQEVTQHESGHAFDFSFAQKNMLNPKDLPSLSSGFNTLVNADLSSLDAAGHPATCTEFGTARTPSGVESGWPTTHLPAVCNGNGVINSTYTGKTNKAISQLVSKYFLAPPSTSLAALFPKLAQEVHPTRNGKKTANDIKAYSQERIWWRCRYNPLHVWDAIVDNRTRLQSGCPTCWKARRPKFFKKLAAQRARILTS